jgi:spermidine synthase
MCPKPAMISRTFSANNGFRKGSCSLFLRNDRGHLDKLLASVRISAVIQLFCFIFFLSGASALIFESLWFQLTGLSLGNSTWAISIVLASFMGGLSLGEGLVAFHGHRIKRPVRLYAFLELIIGISGGLLVLVLPHLTKILVPLFRCFLDQNVLLNILRGTVAFIVMVIPTTAMGATFPVLGKAAAARDPNFGKVLGMLYGWNTLGAVIGVCASEAFLIKWFGLSGTGLIAASFNIFAGSIALWIARKEREATVPVLAQQPVTLGMPVKTWRLLAASGLAGFIFLALEVVWFRFLSLFFVTTTHNFTILLAVVLTGISFGGLFAGYLYQKKLNINSFIFAVVCLNGALVSYVYSSFHEVAYVMIQQPAGFQRMFICARFLAFPIAILSGITFTMLGRMLHDQMASETRTIGFMTLANTIGSMAGSLVAGLVFLPFLGMERTFFLLALAYGVVAILVFERSVFFQSIRKVLVHVGVILAYGFSLAFFPFGLMEHFYSGLSFLPIRADGEHRVAFKEGANETIQYYRGDIQGQPYYYRLATNSYSMSATNFEARRYMSYFVYLPAVMHSRIQNALLICYGVGVTAKALTKVHSIRHIDLVDISKDIVQMSSIVYPDKRDNPVFDPRVKVHIEDGRFFLSSTKKTYDLITGEPPPPVCKGIVNLYTQEHFQLIYDRLSENGMTTYWLPIHQLTLQGAKSIIKGFCNVFDDCSLWASEKIEWMLLGIKKGKAGISYRDFVRAWDDPVLGAEMRDLGFMNPQQLGSLFIADGKRLRDWASGVPALTDNYPKILEHTMRTDQLVPLFQDFLDASGSKTNFMNSAQISRIWPDRLRQETEKYFESRNWILKIMSPGGWSEKTASDEPFLRDPLMTPFLLFSTGMDPSAEKILARVKELQRTAVSKDKM